MLNNINQFKKDALSKCNMPVPGLGISGDVVTYNDIPLSDCCNAEQLDIAISIGIALNPKLKVLLITNGEKLDSDSWAKLEQRLVESGTQAWVERMDESGELGIFIEEGKIAAIDGEKIEQNDG